MITPVHIFQQHKQHLELLLLITTIIAFEVLIGLSTILMPSWISILGIIVTILFVVFCYRIQWGLYFLILFVPLRVGLIQVYTTYAPDILEGTLGSIDIYYIIFLIMLLALIARAGSRLGNIEQIPPINPIIPFLLITLCGWTLVSIFWTPNYYLASMQYIKLFINISIFYFFYIAIDSVTLLRRVAWVWLILGLTLFIISFITVYGVSLPEEVAKVSHNGVIFNEFYPLFSNIEEIERIDLRIFWKIQRDRGTAFCSPHKLSLLQNCLMAMAFCLLLSLKKTQIKQRIFVVIVLILLFASHSTALSKGGTISFVGMIFFLFIITQKVRERIIRNLVVTFFLLVIIFLLVQNTQFSEVAVGRYSAESISQVSLATRLDYWMTIIPPFLQSYGLGLGTGGSLMALYPVPHPHNAYLSILCDMGIFGALLFLLLLLTFVIESISVLQSQKTFAQYMVIASCAGLVAIMIHSLVDFYYNTTEFWMIAGFGVAALKLAKHELTVEKHNAN